MAPSVSDNYVMKKRKMLCTFTFFYHSDYQLKIFVAEAALTCNKPRGDEESGAVPRRADLEAWKAGEH